MVTSFWTRGSIVEDRVSYVYPVWPPSKMGPIPDRVGTFDSSNVGEGYISSLNKIRISFRMYRELENKTSIKTPWYRLCDQSLYLFYGEKSIV